MSQPKSDIKTNAPLLQPEKSNPYLWYGVAAVVVLIAAVVVMLVITSNDVTTTAAPITLSAEAQVGKSVFLSSAANCNSCHPAEGRAGGVGPRLSTVNDSDDTIRRYVRNGNGPMPANKQLSDEQINQLIAYIRALKP